MRAGVAGSTVALMFTFDGFHEEGEKSIYNPFMIYLAQ